MKKIINKYLSNTVTEEELKDLSAWLKEDEKNRIYFRECVREKYLIDLWGLEKHYRDNIPEIPDFVNKGRRFRVFPLSNSGVLKYAAILIIAFGVIYGLFIYPGKGDMPDYEPAAVTLKLGDGTVKELFENDHAVISDSRGNNVVSQQSNRLNYNAGDKESENLAGTYHELNVPRGRRFNIILDDGTEVFLNSETTLRFPVVFDREGRREVYLKGEGYFSVAKDSSKPFRVLAEDVVVEVLGTRFNVRAYEGDGYIKTSLREGSVQVSAGSPGVKPVTITPGQAVSYNQKERTLSVDRVIIENDVAWTDNRLLFIQEPFSEVARKIERSYGVRVDNQYKQLDTVRFYGDFDIRTESVEDVLKAFTTIEFFEYTIQGDVVIIRK